jgi:hypothetical protein
VRADAREREREDVENYSSYISNLCVIGMEGVQRRISQ